MTMPGFNAEATLYDRDGEYKDRFRFQVRSGANLRAQIVLRERDEFAAEQFFACVSACGEISGAGGLACRNACSNLFFETILG
jgi:hypothetical protein